MPTYRTVLCAVLVVISALSMGQFINLAQQTHELRSELAELQDVKYGLLDAESWVQQVAAVLHKRIDEFELTAQNRPALKRQLENMLSRLFLEVQTHLDGERRREKSEVGKALRRLTDRIREILIPFEALRRGVPQYADAILEELNRPQARSDIKQLATAALQAAADSTFTATDRIYYDAILTKHGCAEAVPCAEKIRGIANEKDKTLPLLAALCMAATVLVLVLITFKLNVMAPSGVLAATAAIFILLAGGVLTPMIEIEARISSLQLQVLGEPVVFHNQVLYFQSKSVLDVVIILAETGKVDMVFVAFLVGLFSVVFPSMKLLAGFAYYHGKAGLRASKLVRFFALYSGKWSMADVLVVAIFMAYIGFEGLVASQLDALAGSSKTLDILTTNGTSLMPGYYVFVAFCLCGLAFSTCLEQRAPTGTAAVHD